MQEAVQTTDALNMRELPRRISAAEISDFTVTADLAGERRWLVTGEAIDRFAAMTNWDYYEASLRFQKVLEASGALTISLRPSKIAEWKKATFLGSYARLALHRPAHGVALKRSVGGGVKMQDAPVSCSAMPSNTTTSRGHEPIWDDIKTWKCMKLQGRVVMCTQASTRGCGRRGCRRVIQWWLGAWSCSGARTSRRGRCTRPGARTSCAAAPPGRALRAGRTPSETRAMSGVSEYSKLSNVEYCWKTVHRHSFSADAVCERWWRPRSLELCSA